MKHKLITAFLIIVILLSFLCLLFNLGDTGNGEQQSTVHQIQSIPASMVSDNEDISHMDFVVDAKGVSHVVWTIRNTQTSAIMPEVFYTNSKNGGLTWKNPQKIAEDASGEVKIFSSEEGDLHVLIGVYGRHLKSADEGESWTELDELIPKNSKKLLAFDAVIEKHDLMLTYIATDEENGDSNASAKIYAVRWISSTNVVQKPMHIASLPDPKSTHIRMTVNNNAMQILCALNTLQNGVFTAYLYDITSTDNGATWLPARDILTENISKDLKRPTHISDIELLPTGEDYTAIFYTNLHRIYTSKSYGLNLWTPVTDITDYVPGALAADFYVTSLSGVSINDRVALVWIDSRFTETDRRWWKPLGGWPWSDQPNLSNNDVLFFALSEQKKPSDETESDITTKNQAIRITPSMSLANEVRINIVDNQYIVVWTGRSRVGKTKTEFGKRSELFFTKVP